MKIQKDLKINATMVGIVYDDGNLLMLFYDYSGNKDNYLTVEFAELNRCNLEICKPFVRNGILNGKALKAYQHTPVEFLADYTDGKYVNIRDFSWGSVAS